MSSNILNMERVTVFYGDIPALLEVNLSIPKGARVGVVGPNGAGKSTLFKSLLGLEKVYSGVVSLANISQENRAEFRNVVAKKVAYIPQFVKVNEQFPATVFDIVLMGRYPHITNILKIPTTTDKKKAWEALKRMQLVGLEKRHITELSGGQRQRVFLARALAQEAEVYLMDEPLAGIDAATESLIMETLKEFQKEGKTSLVIHHDIHTLTQYFDYVVWLNKSVIHAGDINSEQLSEWYRQTYQIDLVV